MIGSRWLFTKLQLHEMLSAELSRSLSCWRWDVGKFLKQLLVRSQAIFHGG